MPDEFKTIGKSGGTDENGLSRITVPWYVENLSQVWNVGNETIEGLPPTSRSFVQLGDGSFKVSVTHEGYSDDDEEEGNTGEESTTTWKVDFDFSEEPIESHHNLDEINLDGDLAPHAQLGCAVDAGEPAPPDEPTDLVATVEGPPHHGLAVGFLGETPDIGIHGDLNIVIVAVRTRPVGCIQPGEPDDQVEALGAAVDVLLDGCSFFVGQPVLDKDRELVLIWARHGENPL